MPIQFLYCVLAIVARFDVRLKFFAVFERTKQTFKTFPAVLHASITIYLYQLMFEWEFNKKTTYCIFHVDCCLLYIVKHLHNTWTVQWLYKLRYIVYAACYNIYIYIYILGGFLFVKWRENKLNFPTIYLTIVNTRLAKIACCTNLPNR